MFTPLVLDVSLLDMVPHLQSEHSLEGSVCSPVRPASRRSSRVEHLICNQGAAGSIPAAGSNANSEKSGRVNEPHFGDVFKLQINSGE